MPSLATENSFFHQKLARKFWSQLSSFCLLSCVLIELSKATSFCIFLSSWSRSWSELHFPCVSFMSYVAWVLNGCFMFKFSLFEWVWCFIVEMAEALMSVWGYMLREGSPGNLQSRFSIWDDCIQSAEAKTWNSRLV